MTAEVYDQQVNQRRSGQVARAWDYMHPRYIRCIVLKPKNRVRHGEQYEDETKFILRTKSELTVRQRVGAIKFGFRELWPDTLFNIESIVPVLDPIGRVVAWDNLLVKAEVK